jgi:superfamily II DNA or RNA helicase
LSSTSHDERVALLEKHAAGDLTVLCAVDVLNEGADLPHVECLLFLRPTESKRVFFQQLGRGLRRFTGKSHCIVVDFIGNFKNAYRIPEYQGLLPLDGEVAQSVGDHRGAKEILNLPLGCQVTFDVRVIELFERQVYDPRFATRTNIARVLLYQYHRLTDRLGHAPSRKEVNRYCILHAGFYESVFGSWRQFSELAAHDVAHTLPASHATAQR